MNQRIVAGIKEGKRDKNTRAKMRETPAPRETYKLNEYLTNEINIQYLNVQI